MFNQPLVPLLLVIIISGCGTSNNSKVLYKIYEAETNKEILSLVKELLSETYPTHYIYNLDEKRVNNFITGEYECASAGIIHCVLCLYREQESVNTNGHLVIFNKKGRCIFNNKSHSINGNIGILDINSDGILEVATRTIVPQGTRTLFSDNEVQSLTPFTRLQVFQLTPNSYECILDVAYNYNKGNDRFSYQPTISADKNGQTEINMMDYKSIEDSLSFKWSKDSNTIEAYGALRGNFRFIEEVESQ